MQSMAVLPLYFNSVVCIYLLIFVIFFQNNMNFTHEAKFCCLFFYIWLHHPGKHASEIHTCVFQESAAAQEFLRAAMFVTSLLIQACYRLILTSLQQLCINKLVTSC
jgi:hypothetical protein